MLDNDICQIADWETNVECNDLDERPWYYGDYIHTCDPAVEPYWHESFGEGVVPVIFSFDPITGQALTRVIWTALLESMEADSLYYVEYTTAPQLTYYPPDEQFYEIWCVTRGIGIRFHEGNLPDTITPYTPMEPQLKSEDSGQLSRFSNTLSIGNCYRATGEERYLMFGQFLHDITTNQFDCYGVSKNTWFGGTNFIFDNFRIEKMKAEICCDQIVCSVDVIDFSSYFNQYALKGERYIWNDGVEGIKRSFNVSGRYQLQLEMACGSIMSNTIDITVEECSAQVFVPSAFSPNADGNNDIFTPFFSDSFELENAQLSVYSRWGALVYRNQTGNPVGWDGFIDGKAAASGVYLWHLEYALKIGDTVQQFVKTGDVTLFR